MSKYLTVRLFEGGLTNIYYTNDFFKRCTSNKFFYLWRAVFVLVKSISLEHKTNKQLNKDVKQNINIIIH
ncbi:hypothetical protein BpHYR1_047505 [Brachionus plicatilis]|uniref:Uncharacterized protein n=1 Tax=Brachionus plicatilis TaxID=10195 RepID=A0A3M7PNN4_BRAPC|nr:hypothetical protein BpHYR1_047505 [Brachionus plicatilis]